MAGLNVAEFLKHSSDSGSNGQWLDRWNKDGKGEITVWLHTQAPIIASWTHQFMLEDEIKDKETQKQKPILRFLRFVTPDPEVVSKNQYFREDDKTLQTPPDIDPFLLLREWLRFADHLPLDQPIFKWYDPKEQKTIVWLRGELSGLEKRGQRNFSHSLDTKLEYIYCVVDNKKPSNGPVLARANKLLSKKIAGVIEHQCKFFGLEEGDPTKHPYAFIWIAKDTKSPMDGYDAVKDERAELTDEIWAQISGDTFPDPTEHGQPQDGDMEKIRDAMEAAQQVELPIDQIFSEDPQVRLSLLKPQTAKAPPPRPSKAAQARGGSVPVPTRQKPTTTSAAPATAPAAPVAGAPATRRKKVDKPVEPPPPEVEMISCDDCGELMAANATKCPACGTEYEVDEDDAPAPAPVAAKPAAAPATTTKPKPKPGKPGVAATPATPAVRTRPAAVPAAADPDDGGDAVADDDKCWSCRKDLNGAGVCPHCNIPQDNDDIPF